MNKLKEYKIFEIKEYAEETENVLNSLAKDGWKLICAYAYCNNHLIMERDKKICKECGK